MREGVGVLLSKINLYKPRIVAFGGIGIFRKAFKRPDAVVGLQAESLGGALLWVLPNTSALNAGWKLNDIARAFRDLREFVERAEFAVGPDILADEVEEQKKQQAADQSDEGVDVKVEAGVNLRAEPVISAESQSEVKIEADVTIKLELEETPSTPIDLVSASPSPSPETRAPPSRIPPSPAKRKQQSQDPNPTDAEPTPSDSDSDCEEEQWRPLRATRGNKRIKVI